MLKSGEAIESQYRADRYINEPRQAVQCEQCFNGRGNLMMFVGASSVCPALRHVRRGLAHAVFSAAATRARMQLVWMTRCAVRVRRRGCACLPDARRRTYAWSGVAVRGPRPSIWAKTYDERADMTYSNGGSRVFLVGTYRATVS